MTASIRVAPSLRFFLAPRHRRDEALVTVDGTSTVVHIVESLGVPRTEFGELRINGVPVAADARPVDGDVVDVPERPRPQRLTDERFVLDVHLGTLARRMRLLGLDVAYENDADDDELVELAVRERRTLLTKDRGILRRRALTTGAYVRGASPEQELADVLDRFDPRLHPWSRCPACNGELAPAAKPDIVHLLAAGTRRSYGRFSQCQVCRRLYWRGAHSRRLEAFVDAATGRS